MRDAKSLVYEGLAELAGGYSGLDRLGVLVDERLPKFRCRSSEASDRRWCRSAMSIEKSGTDIFELEYGGRFADHVESSILGHVLADGRGVRPHAGRHHGLGAPGMPVHQQLNNVHHVKTSPCQRCLALLGIARQLVEQGARAGGSSSR